jgi:hypothetical protein
MKSLILIFLLQITSNVSQSSPSYNLETGTLIPELNNSNNDCINKLSPILISLTADEQKIFASAIATTNSTRCFDTQKYKDSLETQLKSLNEAYAKLLGSNLNKQIKSLQCVLISAKNLLDQKYYEYIQNQIGTLTPWGAYPSYTSSLAKFVQNVNYILATRRRYLLTNKNNIDSLGVKGVNGTIIGFRWKKSERSIIVNEFIKLQFSAHTYSTSFYDSFQKIKEYFANSKGCGTQPGQYDKDLFGIFADVKEDGITVDNNPYSNSTSVSTDPTPTSALPTPVPHKIDDIRPIQTGAGLNGSGGSTFNTGIVPPASDTSKPTETVDPTIVNIAEIKSSLVNPNPKNDPCFDWDSYYKNLYKNQTANTSISSSVDGVSSSSKNAGVNQAADTPITYNPSNISQKKGFCPNLIGKDIKEYQLYLYSGIQLKDILVNNKNLLNSIDEFYTCTSTKTPIPEISSFLVALKTKFSNGNIDRNLLLNMKNEVKDPDGGFMQLISLMNTIELNGINGINDFNFSCTNKICYCPDCPKPVKTAFTFLSEDYIKPPPPTPGNNETVSSRDNPTKPELIQPNTTNTTVNTTTTNSTLNTTNTTDISKSLTIANSSLPQLFNAYLTKCGSSIIFFAIYMDPWATNPNIDLKFYDQATGRFISIAENGYRILKTCDQENLQNKNPSSCKSDFFNNIIGGCRSTISDKCGNLANTLLNLNPETAYVKECDILTYDLSNQENYDAFKTNCFKWINSNLIDSTFTLNLNNLANIMNIINKGGSQQLRFLQAGGAVTSTIQVNDTDEVDNDVEASVDSQALTASNENIDIDGSKYYTEMMPVISMDSATGAVPPTTPLSGGDHTVTILSTNSNSGASDSSITTAQAVANMSGRTPPTLSVETGANSILQSNFILLFCLLLI